MVDGRTEEGRRTPEPNGSGEPKNMYVNVARIVIVCIK